MAIVNGMWLKGSKKKLGGTVVYESGGRTIQRVLAPEVRNPRTEAQMSVRVRWSNIVNLYKVLRPVMKYAFEYKKRYQSDYNILMSLNVSHSPVFLTKQEAQQGACIVADYDITQGSLPRIEFEEAGAGWKSNIMIDDGVSLSDMTISEFSRMIIKNNPAWQLGDQFSLVVLLQDRGNENQVPFATLIKNEVILATNNNERLSNYINKNFINNKSVENQGYIQIINDGNICAGTLIHSRTRSGKTYVSSQKLLYMGSEELVTI